MMFEERKATHMAAFLLSKAAGEGLEQISARTGAQFAGAGAAAAAGSGVDGGWLERIKLMKLMYLADRAAWKKAGDSISSDEYASMKYGPVLLNTYNELMKGRESDTTREWDRLISRDQFDSSRDDGTRFKLMRPVSIGDIRSLSQFSCEVMDAIWDEYGGKSTDDLVKITHKFAEWEHPGTLKQKEIKLASILRAVGHSDELVRELVEQAEAYDELDEFLASVRE